MLSGEHERDSALFAKPEHLTAIQRFGKRKGGRFFDLESHICALCGALVIRAPEKQRPRSLSVLVSVRVNGNLFSVFAHTLEFHGAVDEGEQRIVLASADVVAGMILGAALTHENVACQHELPVRALGTESLRRAFTSVVGRTGTFLMSEQLDLYKYFTLPPD